MHFREYIQATGISVFFSFCIFMLNPILAPYVKSLGFDDFQLSLIFSIMPLAIIFSAPIMGRLADDIGRLKVIVSGIVIEIIALVTYILAESWLLITIARFLDAIAIAAVTLVTLAKIEDSLDDKERGRMAGISFSIQHIGAITAPVIGGILADKLFIKAPFLLAAVLLLFLGFMLAIRSPKLHRKIKRKDFDFLDELRKFISIRQLKGMAILGMVFHSNMPALTIFLPLFIIERLELSYSYVGVAIFFLGVAHIFQFIFGYVSDKIGRVKVMLFGTIIYGLFLFMLSFSQTYSFLLLMLLILGTGGAIWNVTAWSLMSDIGERLQKEAEIVGSYMSFAKMGSFVSFLFSGLIVQVYSIETLFKINGLLIIIGSIVAHRYFKEEKPKGFTEEHGLTL